MSLDKSTKANNLISFSIYIYIIYVCTIPESHIQKYNYCNGFYPLFI